MLFNCQEPSVPSTALKVSVTTPNNIFNNLVLITANEEKKQNKKNLTHTQRNQLFTKLILTFFTLYEHMRNTIHFTNMFRAVFTDRDDIKY